MREEVGIWEEKMRNLTTREERELTVTGEGSRALETVPVSAHTKSIQNLKARFW